MSAYSMTSGWVSMTGKGRTQSGRHSNTERNLFLLHVYLMLRSGISGVFPFTIFSK